MKRIFILVMLFTGLTCVAQMPAPMNKPATEDPLKIKFKDKEKRKVVTLEFNYDLQNPGGDMAKRFGTNSAVGFGTSVKTKRNFTLGGEFGFMFGSDVKENTILDKLLNGSGNIIGITGQYARVTISERGYFFLGKAGKVIPVFKYNKNSGFMLSAGVGFIQHKIRIAAPDNDLPSLNKDYKKGYDRLTNGLLVNGFAGFYYLDKKHFVNFYIGYNYMQGFTQSRRDWNYDTMSQDNTKRKDVLQGFRIGWIIPIYPSAKTDEFIFY